ncbi:translation initiation factor IF-2 [Streptomyces himastatinicus ATCC 53653]|uniref:Translation initiation factor IF-2 n=1 Tax=Streptomyces himastatinicus ATCC 53653 TaxID=457427 RepID=D9W7I6_9ACTN|nr:TetR/AcrR family transcriptional regulator [Streptomyces himastatinicus]EFL28766.1 translation initiation factor IF-2 [Streptomyces himastatinicus ATCC 53653]
MAPSCKGRATYHHGDLAAALVRVTLEIVDEVGVRGFSVAEAARRTRVSPGAPYRHFADRDALLAAAALEVSRRLRALYLEAVATVESPQERLATMAGSVVRAAARFRGGYELLYAPGVRTAHPDVVTAKREFVDLLLPSAFEVVSEEHGAAVALLEALQALARGYATLLLDGVFGDPDEVAEDVAARATRSARALVAGSSVTSADD